MSDDFGFPAPTPETLATAQALGPWLASLPPDQQGDGMALVALVSDETGLTGEPLRDAVMEFLAGRTVAEVFDAEGTNDGGDAGPAGE